MTERTRIQGAIISAVMAGKFFEVKYDVTTQLPVDIDVLTAPIAAPMSVKCNEIEGQFQIDEKYGLDRVLKQQTWIFQCLVKWSNQEVTLEYFLRSLAEKPPILQKTSDFRQATLVLLNYTVQHPVLQQGCDGSEAVLTFNAELGRN